MRPKPYLSPFKTMTTKINFNGKIEDDAFVSVFDHGFLFGDSVYEVVSTRNNKTCFLKEHLNRLHRSAAGIDLEIPRKDLWFQNEIEKTLAVTGNPESYIRIVVTRGTGEIDIDPATCKQPNVIIYVTTAKEYPQENYTGGISIALVSIKRNPREALNPGIKTGNYLNNVLAKIEARKLGAADALMLSPSGYLTECTTSNIFFVRGGRLMTPALDCGILAGITRDIVIRLAREAGMLVEEGHWPAEEIQQANEIFLTGTLKRVMPVTTLDGKRVGGGKVGPTTIRLMNLYASTVEHLND